MLVRLQMEMARMTKAGSFSVSRGIVRDFTTVESKELCKKTSKVTGPEYYNIASRMGQSTIMRNFLLQGVMQFF